MEGLEALTTTIWALLMTCSSSGPTTGFTKRTKEKATGSGERA